MQFVLSVLRTASGEHVLDLRLAAGFFSRLRGLMLAAPLRPDQGLLLSGCVSVHTCFLRQSIDLLYLDASGRVTDCVAGLAPWRASRMRYPRTQPERPRHILELAAGSILRFGIRPGDRLQHRIFANR